ncbi:MAG TPA: glycosyltransferase [Rhodanobacteraceae bacterium]
MNALRATSPAADSPIVAVGARPASKPSILFLIRSLARGGAERQLVTLAMALQRSGWRVAVACFYAGGVFQADLARAGIPVIDLRKRGRWDALGFAWRWWRVLRAQDADVVHGYLTVGNLLALFARLAHGHACIAWGVRSSYIDRARYGWLSRLTFRISCRLSCLADVIIVNSWAGAAHHIRLGYPRARVCVVPNGIDVRRFRFDAAGRVRMRRLWHVPDTACLVGVVGRLDPMKDHPTFLKAAGMLAAQNPRWRFVCIGGGNSGYAEELARLANALGLGDRLIWAGAQDDMPAVYSALDVVASASYGEGFPNTVAEAMACGRPCVVTDVGDSAQIVGDCGVVVAARDPVALAAGIKRSGQHWQPGGDATCANAGARARIAGTYAIDVLLRNTEAALRRGRRAPRARARGS